MTLPCSVECALPRAEKRNLLLDSLRKSESPRLQGLVGLSDDNFKSNLSSLWKTNMVESNLAAGVMAETFTGFGGSASNSAPKLQQVHNEVQFFWCEHSSSAISLKVIVVYARCI